MHSGSCLCGSVQYRVGVLPNRTAVCHCGQCRRQSGHLWTSGQVPREAFEVTASQGLSWFQSSAKARRGFCENCGAFLFWEHDEDDTISVSLGSFDDADNLSLERHIFVRDKGSYYLISDGLPQEENS